MRKSKSFDVSRKFILLTVLITWGPLAVFSFPDISTNIKFCFSLPLLLLSFSFVQKKFVWMCRIFEGTGLVREREKNTFDVKSEFGERLAVISRFTGGGDNPSLSSSCGFENAMEDDLYTSFEYDSIVDHQNNQL